VIDGATNAVSDAGGSAAGAMQDPVTNRFYRWDSTLGPVGSTSYSWSARDASIYVVATPPAGAAAAVASQSRDRARVRREPGQQRRDDPGWRHQFRGRDGSRGDGAESHRGQRPGPTALRGQQRQRHG
jgi:hypothetical protein